MKQLLRDIAIIGAGQGAPQGDSNYCDNGTPFIKAGNMEYLSLGGSLNEIQKVSESVAKSHKLKLYPKGTVLFAKSGMSCLKGFVYVLPREAYVVSHLACITPSEEISDYLRYYFQYHKPNKLVKDAAYPSISLSDIGALEIDIKDEQSRESIIETLKSAEKLIDLRKQEVQLLDDLIKARFVEISNSNKSSNLLSEFITPFSAQRCGERDLPVLSITKADGIVFQDAKFKKRIASTDASTYKVIPRGKLVQGIHIDERNFAIQNITDEGIVSPAYKVWSVNNNKAIPEVLAYALRSDYAMAYISSKFTGSVKRRESISNNDFLAMPINLPPIEAQKTIYMFMQQIDKSKVVCQKVLINYTYCDKINTINSQLIIRKEEINGYC